MRTALALAWAVLLGAALLRRQPKQHRSVAALDPRGGRRRHRWRLPGGDPRRISARANRRALADSVPDVVDLLAVAVNAGLNTRLAVEAVAERGPPGPLTNALRIVLADVAATGVRLADALQRIPDDLGSDAVRPIVTALVDADRYGSALGATLDRLGDDARRTRQRRAEEAARRVPVKLLFPLVTCILPAFGLLTVAPLIAGGLRALRL
ncbi:MAG TPA: type II secretion system F family protein [Acidimicrobiales bacterium]|nr:type II secretion system F family protein [Acidimicrobiales bacterium]